MTALLYLVFILSGLAGLIYESIWSRYLGLFVGHSAYAQIIVLVIFLGGMSVGALAAGRWTARMRDPLLGYAAIELVVGIIGLAFHDLFEVAAAFAYDSLFPALPGGASVTAAKWLLAALLILPQSVLLGATFPLMSAGAIRRAAAQPGRVLSMLYFANSLGAAAGSLVAGFLLIRWVGLPGTLLTAAAINIVVAVVVYFAARAVPAPGVAVAEDAGIGLPIELPLTLTRDALRRLLLWVSFGTAVASFIYEIAWIRMLSLVLGSATHSFELMLSAFILGLALGALWVRRRVDEWRDPTRVLGTVQVIMGLLAVATLPIYVASFYLTEGMLGMLNRSEGGYIAFAVARYAIALAVMLPATFCAGMTLPLITRTLLAAGAGERSIGDVYGVNTLGSIVGVSFAGLLGLPWLGLKGLQAAGAAIDMGLGLLLFARSGTRAPRRRTTLASFRRHDPEPGPPTFLERVPVWGWGVIAAAAVLAIATPFDSLVLTSGVYRQGRLLSRDSFEPVFYEDGRTATVTARRNKARSHYSIATNGKPDASMRAFWLKSDTVTPGAYQLVEDEPTQVFLPLVTLAHAPRATEAAVIGQGAGVSSHVLLGSPSLRVLETIEIEPAMVRGSRTAFYPANRRVFDDERSRFVIDDAKAHFAAGQRRYDIIMSEPSNPWVSGVSGLFTTEFYSRVKRHLKPGGVFGQWLHLYEISDDLVLTVLAAVHENFPAYEIYLVSGGDILIVASADSVLRPADWSVLEYPGIARDLRPFVPATAATMNGMWIANRAVLAPLLAEAKPNSDFYPFLDLGTERTRFLRARADGIAEINSGRLDPVAMLVGRRADFDTATTTIVPSIPRLGARATGARLRRVMHAAGDTVRGDADADEAIYAWSQLRAAMTTGRPPADWQMWTQHVLAVDAVVHGGTAGVADTAFFSEIERYLARAGAPAGVRDAIAFARAFSSWNWTRVSQLADSIIQTTVTTGDYLVPAAVLHDATVIARLHLGDLPGARQAHRVLRVATGRKDGDLAMRLMVAHMNAATNQEIAGR